MTKHFEVTMKQFYTLLFTSYFDEAEYPGKAQWLLQQLNWKKLLTDDWEVFDISQVHDSDYTMMDFIEEKWRTDIFQLLGQYS
ncbi:hypothetical protein [Fructobacillus tropaeoli]|uniref:hypothetical protein n=1 Tax=Fructobacillus tropaeoli TaxID=709323 RepID=UPI002D95390E|nr:unnamed protein product [Fructobacillus tropaeoli]